PGDADHPRRMHRAGEKWANVSRNRVDVLSELLSHPHRTDVDADGALAHDEFGGAAADVEHDRVVVDVSDAAQRQRRLLLAREQLRREAVAPLDLAEERLAVLGV